VFVVDDALLEDVRPELARLERLGLVLGGSGSGKSTVCAELATRHGVEVLDMDARLYGSWHGSFDPVRHPANAAWSGAPDPLAWMLRLSADEFLAFHAAAAAEALDLLVAELRGRDPDLPLVVDGGFASVTVPARVVSPSRIVVLALPAAARSTAWTGSPDRRAFLDVVAGVAGVPDPVERFLAMDVALSDALDREAAAAGVRVLERREGVTVEEVAAEVAAQLRLA
jgi:hypothetical protein